MDKFVVSATVDDPDVIGDAKFTYEIIDNDNYWVDEYKVDGKDLHEVYPNSNKAKLNKFVAQLSKLKNSLSREGITIVPRDVTVNGTIKTIDGKGVVHTVNVAGTLDLLGYDRDGNWYIYDMKTHKTIQLTKYLFWIYKF